MYSFSAQTADEAWLAAVAALSSEAHAQSSRGGPTRELIHVALEVRNPQDRWVLSRNPALNPAAYIVEVIWILRGRNDSALINFWNPQFPRFAGEGPTYHGAYGDRLRQNFGIDQLQRAYEALRDNPETRQVCLTIWDPTRDLPAQGGAPRAPDIPCNVISLLKLRDEQLEWTQIVRSNDLWRGLPVNLVQFTCLQEIMAGWLGVETGVYCHWSDSLHVYESDLANLSQTTPVEVPANSDSLALPKAESDAVVEEIERRLDAVLADELRENQLRLLAALDNIPRGYSNLLLVALADAARRKGWSDLAVGIMENCTNPALCRAWQRWIERVPGS